MYKYLTVSNVAKFVRSIPKGTFNYKKFCRDNQQMKTITSYDRAFEFAAQLPYLKLITYPVGLTMYITGLYAFIGYVYVSDLVIDLRNKKDA